MTELVKLLKNYNFPIEEIGPKLNDTQIIEPISSQDQLVIEKQKLHLVNYKVLENFPQGDTAIYFDYEELINRVKDGEGNLGIKSFLRSDIHGISVRLNGEPKSF